MAFEFDRRKMTAIAVAIILLLALRWMMKGRVGRYSLQPVPLMATYTNTQDINALPNELSCVVGPGESSGYYSRGLTPGGLCGDQKMIREQMRGYRILGGVGGGLLEK
jgi:hypothetical protein